MLCWSMLPAFSPLILALFVGQPGTNTSTASPQIELITMSPGPELYSFWGHAALRVIDRANRRDLVYNFGSVDFSGNFFKRMLEGEVDAYVSVTPYRGTVDAYASENRTVTRRTLNLAPERASYLARELRQRIGSPKRTYKYHHFLDNCSTQVADAIDRAADGALARRYSNKPGRPLRDLALERIEPHWIYYAGVDLVLNGFLRRDASRWDSRFLPSHLATLIDESSVGERPLSGFKMDVHRSTDRDTNEWAGPWTKVRMLLLLPLVCLILMQPRIGALVWGLTATLLGLGVLAVTLIARYDFITSNVNTVIVPATHCVIFVAAARGSLWRRKILDGYLFGHGLILLCIAIAAALGFVAQPIAGPLSLSLIPAVALIAARQRQQ